MAPGALIGAMADPTPVTEAPEAVIQPAVAEEPRTEEAPLVEADLIVEDVSIDGMCGVY
jgi:mycofactocin precursor